MKRAVRPRISSQLLPLLLAASLQAAPAEAPHDFARWEKDISAFETSDRTNPPPRGGILFIGSSTIRLWTSLASDYPGEPVINRGFGGSEIADSTHFAARIIFPYEPRKIFLRAGGNDLFAGKAPEAVLIDFQEFCATIHSKLPRTEIYYLAASPSISRWSQSGREAALNKLIANYARQLPRVHYVDAWDIPLGADGKPRPELFSDQLHFNADGYKMLAERVRPYVVEKARGGWEPVGLSGGGGMFAPGISPADPNLMMINCDMSGAYMSEDGGRSWRMIRHDQCRSDTDCRPAFHPTNPNVLFASSGGQLRISHDRGWTFSPIGNLKSSLRGEIAIDPTDPDWMLAGTANDKTWVSRDGGLTWSVCAGPEGKVLGIVFDQTRDAGVAFIGTDKGVWRSTDGGTNWVRKTEGLPWSEIQGFAGASDRNSGVVMLYCGVRSKVEDGGIKGGIYRSRDRGETWESAMGQGLNTETQPADEYAYGPVSQYQHLLSSDARPLTVYAMNTATGFHPPHFDTVFRSDDGGAHWRATYYMDPRFKDYNVEPDYETASCGQSFKGGEVPFGAAICNSDPERLLLVRNEAHVTHNGGTK